MATGAGAGGSPVSPVAGSCGCGSACDGGTRCAYRAPMATADPIEATLHAGVAPEAGGEPPAELREAAGAGAGVGTANPAPPPDDDMEYEVEGRRTELDGGDVVAPLRTMGAAVLGSVGDGRGGGTALRGVTKY